MVTFFSHNIYLIQFKISVVQFAHNYFDEMSLNEIIYDEAIVSVPFAEQILVILVQKEKVHSHKTKSIDPLRITKVVGIERNPKAQIYRVPSLSSCLHFTSSKAHIEAISRCINHERKLNDPLSVDVPVTIIKNNSNHQCKVSTVYNVPRHIDSQESSGGDNVLNHIHDLLLQSCEHGLLQGLVLSDTRTGRSVPSISYGWSMTNAHQYSANRCNIIGSVKPFMSDPKKFKKVGIKAKRYLFDLIHRAIEACPQQQDFNIRKSKSNKVCCDTRMYYRKEFNKCFRTECGMSENEYKDLSCEAFSVIIPSCIRAHRDILNDHRRGMKGVIQINTMLPFEESIVGGGRIVDWLKHCGFTKEFPISVICYSRKVIGDYAEKIEIMNDFKNDNSDGLGMLRTIVSASIMNVDTVRNCYSTFESTAVITSSLVQNAINTYEQYQAAISVSKDSLQAYMNELESKISTGCDIVPDKKILFSEIKYAIGHVSYEKLCWRDALSHIQFPSLHSSYTGPTLTFLAGFDKMVSFYNRTKRMQSIFTLMYSPCY